MSVYDWIVVGAGITGSALAYELSKKGLKVLLLEKNRLADNATVYSYGGLAYWSGTTTLTRRLGQIGLELHRQLSNELDSSTGFRELDLLLTVETDENPVAVAQSLPQFAVKPEILNPKEACTLEPLLNPAGISGALRFSHGQVNPIATVEAYQQAFLRNRGKIEYAEVIDLVFDNDSVGGVVTSQNSYYAANTVVCAGGLTRTLLKNAGIENKVYFTHAQVIKTAPNANIRLNTIVMPAKQKRFVLEAAAQDLDWDRTDDQIIKSILDPGVVQLEDNSFYLGQISAIIPNPYYKLGSKQAEKQIRANLAPLLPAIAQLPGTCHQCLVAFNTERIAVVGNLKNIGGIYLFTGFTSTIVFAPPLAREFANWVVGEETQNLIEQLR